MRGPKEKKERALGVRLGLKGDRAIVGFVVDRHGHEVDFRLHLAIESVKVREEKSPRELSASIGPEVKKENHVAIPNSLLVRMRKNQRLEEFIGFPLLGSMLDGLLGRALNNLALS